MARRPCSPATTTAKPAFPKPLHLIEKGVLKGFVLTRQPVKGFEGSNGRSRLPAGAGGSGAAISNLFVSSSNTVPAADLKKNLIDLIQARSKPYGILVRQMDYPSVGGGAPGGFGGQPGGGRPVSAPVLVYKVFPDGREELVRGLRFRNFNVRSLKDILSAGDDSQVFEYLNSQGNFSAETCVVGAIDSDRRPGTLCSGRRAAQAADCAAAGADALGHADAWDSIRRGDAETRRNTRSSLPGKTL